MKKKTVKKLVAVMKTNRKSGITKTIITQEKVMTSKRHQKQMKEIAEQNAKYKGEHKGQLTYKNKTSLFMVLTGGFAFSLVCLKIYKSIILPLWLVLPILLVFFTFTCYFAAKMLNGLEYPIKK